jgi:hypothetical protein
LETSTAGLPLLTAADNPGGHHVCLRLTFLIGAFLLLRLFGRLW